MVTLNFSSEVYVVNEGTGPVQVCLEKDKDTAIALRIGITAGELDRAEAKGIDCAWFSVRDNDNI